MTEKTSSENKRKDNDQESPLELDYFDHTIPQLPLTKELLKVMIVKINVINNKIDFITRHFIPDPT